MPSWKHGCFLAEYLVWFIHDYSADVNISLSPSRLLFFCVLRHIQPAVQLLLVAQLAQRLAEQLDCETGNCQFPVLEASVPPSDSQLQKLLSQRILCVSHFNHVQNARCSTPRRMFERAWNSGSRGIIR